MSHCEKEGNIVLFNGIVTVTFTILLIVCLIGVLFALIDLALVIYAKSLYRKRGKSQEDIGENGKKQGSQSERRRF
ncbi:hypothetical protein [Bacillus sp. FJAT-44742]|uniref:hypothetical protein n=1 Tax=Bacillus sp. FJAT-44742 TaxID=2014005 RepID=UPI000C24BC1B|nr:hypothetical protein [Bacillus sp. FJAT-44742]